MTHVVTNQPIGNPPPYDSVVDQAPEFDGVIPVQTQPEPIDPEEELKKKEARREPSIAVDDCCCLVDDDADFCCITLVRCIAGMFHGMGVCLDGCCEGCAECVNSCCNNEGCCSCEASDIPGSDTDCSCCDASCFD